MRYFIAPVVAVSWVWIASFLGVPIAMAVLSSVLLYGGLFLMIVDSEKNESNFFSWIGNGFSLIKNKLSNWKESREAEREELRKKVMEKTREFSAATANIAEKVIQEMAEDLDIFKGLYNEFRGSSKFEDVISLSKDVEKGISKIKKLLEEDESLEVHVRNSIRSLKSLKKILTNLDKIKDYDNGNDETLMIGIDKTKKSLLDTIQIINDDLETLKVPIVESIEIDARHIESRIRSKETA
jgi:hypothetical protein